MASKESVVIHIDEQGFVFETGVMFRGLTISETSGGFNCVLRGREANGNPVYAMTTAEIPDEGLNRLWDAVRRGNGSVMWRHDRFAAQKEGG